MTAAPSQAAALAAFVKSRAHDAGFDLAGVTTADPPPHHQAFLDWVSAKRHGEMAYLESQRAREARRDPGLLLPGCQSILVVGAAYTPASPVSPSAGPKVASYAQGDDYHEVIKARLQAVVEGLEAHVGRPVPHRIYVDTGPVLERELAQRAGLGWIGKNTCLISPAAGSYFLLGVVLLGVALEPDRAFESDQCGTCTRCLDACPTACIMPDRTLDASRCISYLTIELRGAVPKDLRRLTGDWIFGCDICQDVCPWNQRFATPAGDPAFQPRPFIRSARPEDWIALDRSTYTEALRRSPLKRAKLAGLKRNACLAAGNAREVRCVPQLLEALADDEIIVRQHAAWALGEIGGETAMAGLRARVDVEPDAAVLGALQDALARISIAGQPGR